MAQVVKGSSTEFAELAGPVTWWVGKCRPEVTEDKVKEVLAKLAEKCGVTDFIVESVHCLTKDPNPWSKSFKVCVPARLKELMNNPKCILLHGSPGPSLSGPEGSSRAQQALSRRRPP